MLKAFHNVLEFRIDSRLANKGIFSLQVEFVRIGQQRQFGNATAVLGADNVGPITAVPISKVEIDRIVDFDEQAVKALFDEDKDYILERALLR